VTPLEGDGDGDPERQIIIRAPLAVPNASGSSRQPKIIGQQIMRMMTTNVADHAISQ
jgi:hypothetical protein